MISIPQTTEMKYTPRVERRRWPREYYAALVRRLQNNGAKWTAATPRAIGITSSSDGQGVSTVAANMALAAANMSAGRVLLVDANVRQPSLAQRFGIGQEMGLVNALRGQGEALECTVELPVAGLSLMTTGTHSGTGELTYDAESVSKVLEQLKRSFQLIVFDLPAANDVTPCCSLAGQLDGVLLVVETESVSRFAAVRAKRQLEQFDATILGLVCNKTRQHVPDWLYRVL